MPTLTYPERLYKNEGPFTHGDLSQLAGSRVAVAGLGAYALGAVGLAQLGIGTAPGGWLRVADPDEFESHNSNRQAVARRDMLGRNKTEVVAAHIRELVPEVRLEPFPDGVTLENLDTFLADAELVVDAVDFLRPQVKFALHRRARRLGLPVISALLVDRGAVAYCFGPQGPDFETFFGFPEEPELARHWRLPLSRILVRPRTPAELWQHFQILNGHRHIPSNSLSAGAAQLLVNHLVVSRLLGQPVPEIPEVAYLEPTGWSMGSVDLGPEIRRQAQSPWTHLAPLYDRYVSGSVLYSETRHRAQVDLAGCRCILEAGCGTGALCAALAGPDRTVIGLEPNHAMLARSLARADELRARGLRLDVGEGVAEGLCLPSGHVDGYLSNQVLFETQAEAVLREAARVLKPGGRLVLSSFERFPDPGGAGREFPDEPGLEEFLRQSRRVHQACAQLLPGIEVANRLGRLGFSQLSVCPAFGGSAFYLTAVR